MASLKLKGKTCAVVDKPPLVVLVPFQVDMLNVLAQLRSYIPHSEMEQPRASLEADARELADHLGVPDRFGRQFADDSALLNDQHTFD